MPTVLRIAGFRFFFYSNEHLPIHIHVAKGEGEVRIQLEPEISVTSVHNLKAKEIKQVLTIVEDNKDFLIKKWHEFFRG